MAIKDCPPSFTDFVDGTNIGVIESRRGSRLPAETFQSLRIAGQVLGQKFQCHKAAKLSVFGLVNHTHPTAAQLPYNAVMGHSTASRKVLILLGLLLLRDGTSAAASMAGLSRKLPACWLCPQQRAYFAFQRFVARTCTLQKRIALLWRTFQHCLKQLIDLFPAVRVHRSPRQLVHDRARPWRCSSRASR